MIHPRTCFIVSPDAKVSFGPYTVPEAIERIAEFYEKETGVAGDAGSIRVWNLGWPRSRPLDVAVWHLNSDLRRTKWNHYPASGRATRVGSLSA